ncbi:hypothetical protein BJ508DRAFT_67421 [Ascobolus immersus RN42]|uniref:Uncharacterized protein n=1 Tax=Ascobolus immersus RN42 TaxID=1160509 RepID=A0A3N4HH37_ASCIM|nr:hypothetical protein BJ508DRAFT_67421 [Ascobolus immersus RN42]
MTECFFFSLPTFSLDQRHRHPKRSNNPIVNSRFWILDLIVGSLSTCGGLGFVVAGIEVDGVQHDILPWLLVIE